MDNFLLTFIGKSNQPMMESKAFIKAFKLTILEQLAAGNEVYLPGVGKFKVVERAARPGKNLHTGETMTIKAHNAVKFVPSKTLKDKVN